MEDQPWLRTYKVRPEGLDYSMPCMELAQASVFGFFLLQNFPTAFKAVGGPMGMSQMVMAISYSKIYFHCHYMGDTIAGMMTGVIIGMLYAKFGLKPALKNVFMKFLAPGDAEIFSDDM